MVACVSNVGPGLLLWKDESMSIPAELTPLTVALAVLAVLLVAGILVALARALDALAKLLVAALVIVVLLVILLLVASALGLDWWTLLTSAIPDA